MRKDSFAIRCAVVVLVLVATPTVALAYIDPGNGAYMVQAVFTLIGASLFYLRHPIRLMKQIWSSLLSRWKQSPNSAPHDAGVVGSVSPNAEARTEEA